MEEEETARLALRILRDPRPESLAGHVRKWGSLLSDSGVCLPGCRTAGAIILKLAYGYTTREEDDPFVHSADVAVDQFSKTTEPGAFVVDVLPFRTPSSLLSTADQPV